MALVFSIILAAVIVMQISSSFFIGSSTQIYNYCFMQFSFHQLGRKSAINNTYIIESFIFVYAAISTAAIYL